MSLLIKALLPSTLSLPNQNSFIISNSTFLLSSLKIGNQTIKMKSSARLPVKGALRGRFNGNRDCRFLHLQSFSKDSKFWQEAKKVQSLVQSAFIQGRAVCPWAIKGFRNVCQCPVIGLAAAIVCSHPGRLRGKMMTPGKSSQVYSALGLRLLGKKIIGV